MTFLDIHVGLEPSFILIVEKVDIVLSEVLKKIIGEIVDLGKLLGHDALNYKIQ